MATHSPASGSEDQRSAYFFGPTAIGALAILVWGVSLPLYRYVQLELGRWYTIGLAHLIYTIIGIGTAKSSFRTMVRYLRVPSFWVRWLGFVGHNICGLSAIGLVQAHNVPLVILIHYLWPTAVLITSIFLGSVRVAHTVKLVSGCILVVGSFVLKVVLCDSDVGLLAGSTHWDFVAYALAFIGAIFWGIYSGVGRKYGALSGGGAVLPFFTGTLTLLLPYHLVSGGSTGVGVFPHLLLLGYCLMGFLAFRAWDHGMAKGNVVVLSLAADFIPWISLLVSAVFLSVEVPWGARIAAVLLVFGAMVTRSGVSSTEKQQGQK